MIITLSCLVTYLSKSITKVVPVIPNTRVNTILYKSKCGSFSCPVNKRNEK